MRLGLRPNTVTELSNQHPTDFRYASVRTLLAIASHLGARLEVAPADAYRYALATESAPGSLTFPGLAPVATQPSDPTQGSRWYRGTLNPAYPGANGFIGDYSNIAAKPGGGVVAYWTDLREQACFGSLCAHGEDAYFASIG